MVITIGGEYGSGSAECARIAAALLGYKVYDDEIAIAVYKISNSCIDESTLKYYDERESEAIIDEAADISNCVDRSGMLKSLSLDVLPSDLRLDIAINGALKSMAETGDCILIGRCANYYLRGRDDVISIFFADTHDHKISRVMKELDCDEITAQKVIKKVDKRRADFYSYFTGESWDGAGNYDIRINCALLGEQGSAKLIKELVLMKEESRKEKLKPDKHSETRYTALRA